MKKSALRTLIVAVIMLAVFSVGVCAAQGDRSDVTQNNPGEKINIELLSKFALLSAPVSWVTFDNDLTDQADGSQSLTATGSYGYVAGPVLGGQALHLDSGDGNYVSMSQPLAFNEDSFTISFWYKGETKNNQVILSNKSFENPNSTAGWAIYTSSNQINMNLGFAGDSVKPVSFGRNTFDAAAWRHVTFVVDRDTMLATLYIDGFPMAVTTLTLGDLDTLNPIRIGADTAGGRGGNDFSIADLKIWNAALSNSTVQLNYKDYNVNAVDLSALHGAISRADNHVTAGLSSGFNEADFDYLASVLAMANTVANTQNTALYTQETVNYYARELDNAIFIYEKSNKQATPADLNLITQGDTEISLNPAAKQRVEEDFRKQLAAFPQADAILIAGDVTGGNAASEHIFMKEMRDVYEKLETEGLFDNVKLYMVRGNHDFSGTEQYVPEGTAGAWNPDTESYDNNFLNGAYRVQVKGYNILGFDGAYDNANTTGKINGFLDDIKAEGDYDPSKPVFMFCHYPISNTIWGGVWSAGAGTEKVAQSIANSNMSQIVYFSGHTHYDPTDERSFYQGNATYYEVGSNSYSTYIDPGPYGGYIEGSYISYKTTPRILEFVEIYGTKMIIKYFNLSTEQYLGVPIVATVGEGTTAFTYSKSETKDLIAPEFEENSITIDSCKSDKIDFTLKQASDNVRVLEYNVQVINTLTGNVEKSFNSLAKPREVPFEEYREYSVTGLTPETPYILRVFAADSMYNRSFQDVAFTTPETIRHQITPNETSFDLANPADVEIHCALPEDTTIDSVKYGSTALAEGTDYEYVGDTLTIKQAYLDTFFQGKRVALSIEFSEGENQLLSVYIVDTGASGGNDCELISHVTFEDNTYYDEVTEENLTAQGSCEIVSGAYGTSKAAHISPGNGNYLDYGTNSTTFFGDDSFTISFWYKGDLKAYDTMLGNKNWGTARNTGIYFGSYQHGIIGFNVGDGSKAYYVNTGDLAAYDIKNTWTLITAVIDRDNVDNEGKGTCYILINGNVEAVGKIPVENYYDDSRSLKLGVCGDKTYGNNDTYMDDLYIWKGAMSIQGVQSLYQSYKEDVTIDGVTVNPHVYDGNRIVPTGTPAIDNGGVAVEDVTPIYTYQGIEGTEYGPNNRAPKDAGSYSLTLSMPIASGYTGSGTPIEFTIAKAPLTVDAVAVENKVYDGTTTATVTEVTFGGLQNGETLAVTADYEVTGAAFAGADVQQQVAVTGTVALGTSAIVQNYELTDGAFPAATKADIAKAPLTVDAVAVENKVYDGTTTATVTAVTFGGLQNGETLAFTTDYQVTGTTFASANAGSDIAVTGTVALKSTALANNYALADGAFPAATKANITKAPLTVDTVTIKNKTYDGTTTATVTDVTFGGLQNGETLAMTADYETVDAVFASANAGKQIAVTGTVVLTASAKAKNYSLADDAFPATTQADITRIYVPNPAILEATPPAPIVVSVGASSFDLRTIVLSESDYGDRSFSLGTLTDAEGIFADAPSIGENGYTLSYTVGNTAPKDSTAMQVITITTQKYAPVEVTITFKMGEIKLSWQNPFTDVAEADWYYDDVRFVHENELYTGTSATTFSPNDPMTRGMVVTVLGRYAKADVSNYTSSSFVDVEAGLYYTPYIEWADREGIVYGISATHFAPDQNVTREQIAAIFYRYVEAAELELPLNEAAVSFGDDGQISAYAKDAVGAMQRAGIMEGKGENRFDPQGDATRAEVAAMLHRLALAVESIE